MTIIIPMAGFSSRFAKAGYTLPKYMLYIKDKTLFSLAVDSFKDYFQTCNFVFVARDVYDTARFINEECKLLGISNFQVVITTPTSGQAETVYNGIIHSDIKPEENILIFNIDTFRPHFTLPNEMDSWDGYLECFIGNGSNWSYAKTEDGTPESKVIETTEKRSISNFCSTGIYYFKHCSDFVDAFCKNAMSPIDGQKESFVAPLYNYLIHTGRNIHINIVDLSNVIFCGTPKEYIDVLEKCISLC